MKTTTETAEVLNDLIQINNDRIEGYEKARQELIESAAEIALMRGGTKQPAQEEQVTIDFAFATVCAIAPIKKGEILTKENIWVKRPGTGKILAEHFNDLIGKTAVRAIENDEQLDFPDFE